MDTNTITPTGPTTDAGRTPDAGTTKHRRSIDTPLRTLFVLALAAFVASLFYAAQPTPEPRALVEFDGPTFNSVHALTWDADVVVQGKVTKVLGPQMDFGGEKPMTVDPADGETITGGGLPMMLYQVRIQDGLVGELSKGDVVTVALLNHNKVDSDQTTRLKRGDDYMFFMANMGANKVLSLDTAGQDLYLPLNYSNGVMAVDGDSVKLNSWVLGLDAAEAEKRAFMLSQVEEMQGVEALQIELFNQANVEVDMASLRKAIETAR